MYLKSYVLEIMKNDTKSCKILVLVIQLNQTHMNHLQLAKYFPHVTYLFHPGVAEVWNIAVSCLEFSYIWQIANCESSTSEQIALPKVVFFKATHSHYPTTAVGNITPYGQHIRHQSLRFIVWSSSQHDCLQFIFSHVNISHVFSRTVSIRN